MKGMIPVSDSHQRVLSVLKQWTDHNEVRVQEYFDRHDWLPADRKKLLDFKREHKIVTLAISRTTIYGIDCKGHVCATGRENLGIADNFQ